MTCAIYIRVSSTKQTKGYSLEAQEKLAIELCKKNNWGYQIFREAGRSADKETLDNRPELQKILDSVEEGKIQYCFVTELDRLSRNRVTLTFIKRAFKDNGVKIATLGRTYDLEDVDDDFWSEFEGLFAWRENRIRVKRSQRGRLEAALKGKWMGSGILPFGYKKDKDKFLIIDEEEANTYKMMVDWSLAGKGVNTIARLLNDMGTPTKKIKYGRVLKWKAGTVLGILRSPLYKGELIYKNNKTACLALISKEKWQEIQDTLRNNYNNAKRNTKRFYLLRGLLYCKKCGRKLFGLIKPSRGMHCYCCLSKRPDPEPRFCGLKNINLIKLNNLVWERMREIALNSSKLKEVIESQKSNSFIDGIELEVQIVHLDKVILSKDEEIRDILRRKNNYKSVTEEDIDKLISEIKSERGNLLIQKNELEEKLKQIKTVKEQANHIENYLKMVSNNIDQFNEQEKYEFLHLLIDKIIVDWDEINKEHTIEIICVIPVEEPSRQELSKPPIATAQCLSWYDAESGRGGKSLFPLLPVRYRLLNVSWLPPALPQE